MPKFQVTDLAAGKGSTAMHASLLYTCYDLALYSLVVTGDLKAAVLQAWRNNVPKSNTFLIVEPDADLRLINPNQIPAKCLIGFYRRFRKGETSQVMWESAANWVCFHMVRSMDTANSTYVVGGNNGDRNGTISTWSKNDVTSMFDWTGTTTPKIDQGQDIPAPHSFGLNGVETYVPFYAPIATVVARLNWAYTYAARG